MWKTSIIGKIPEIAHNSFFTDTARIDITGHVISGLQVFFHKKA
jgi:hypothetical protein